MRIVMVALCGAVLLQAQKAPQPTFKSTTELVEVDATVLDKHGNFVTGLKAEDITIFENGKPQKIQQFFLVTHDLVLPEGAPASENADQAQYGAHRVFVVVFDEAHLANDSLTRVKAGAEGFVHEMFGAGDAGGVFLNGGMYKGRLTVDKRGVGDPRGTAGLREPPGNPRAVPHVAGDRGRGPGAEDL